jgi:hypothetical protein
MSSLRGSRAKIFRTAFVLWFAVALTASLIPSTPTLACYGTSIPIVPETTADYVNRSDIIVEGTVVNVLNYSPQPPDIHGLRTTDGRDIVIIEVAQYLKGSGPAIIHMQGFADAVNSGLVCSVGTGVGAHMIFYALSDTGGFYQFYGDTRPEPTIIAEILQASGQSPIIPPTPSPNVNQTPLSQNNALIVSILGIVVVFLIMIGFYVKRSKRH